MRTLLFARGSNVVQVQRWLGHHSASFTLETYSHMLPDEPVEPLSLPSAEVEGGSEAVLAGASHS
jgi:integrase